MNRKSILLGLLLCVVLGITAHAEEKGTWKETSNEASIGHRHELALGAGLRTDESQWVDARPEVSVKYLRWFSRFAAVTADLGFTDESSFSWRSSARTVAIGAGFRLQEPGGFGSVFFEPGLSLHRHSGDLNGSDFSETRLGISVTMGASLKVHKDTHLDVSFRQIINNAGGRPVYVLAPMPEPPPDDRWDGMGGADTYDLYSPTHVVVSLRFGL